MEELEAGEMVHSLLDDIPESGSFTSMLHDDQVRSVGYVKNTCFDTKPKVVSPTSWVLEFQQGFFIKNLFLKFISTMVFLQLEKT